MKKPLNYCTWILFLLSCLIILFSGCRSADDDQAVTVAAIQVTPSSTSLNAGQVVQLSAALLYTNATTNDCSSAATWSSSDTAVATFSATTNGLLSAITAGTTTIVATCSGVAKSYTMTVLGVATLQSIEVSPVNKTIADTTKLIVTATGVYSDNSTLDLTDLVNWTSSTTNVLVERSSGSDSIQVNANTGIAVTPGTPNIEASYAGVTGSTTINVSTATLSSVIVTPVNPAMGVGARHYLKAVGLFNDNTAQEITDFATWSSDATGISLVSNTNKGLTEAVAAGSATITAKEGAPTGTTTITVGSATLDSIEIYPPTQTMVPNSSLKYSAIGIYSDNTTIDLTKQVTWSASDSDLLSVDNTLRNAGRATALTAGTVYLSVSLMGSTVGASAVITISALTLSSIEVTPKDPSFPANLDLNFEATGVFSDGSTQDLTDSVIWSSSNTTFLKINNTFQIRGQARSIAAGTATVTATFSSISGTSSATVSNATLSSVQITPSNSSMASGYKKQMTATGLYSDNTSFDLTPFVSWRTSAGTAVKMNNIKPMQGVAVATTNAAANTIAVSFKGVDGQDAVTADTTSLTPTTATLSSIEIAPSNPSCVPGIEVKLTATGVFSDSTTMDMTPFVVWKSSDLAVSTANNAPGVQGQFQCVATGSSTVTASSGGISGTATLFVF